MQHCHIIASRDDRFSTLLYKTRVFIGVPDGIRTHVIAVKGRCPGPD
jgi:hypothetical protein